MKGTISYHHHDTNQSSNNTSNTSTRRKIWFKNIRNGIFCILCTVGRVLWARSFFFDFIIQHIPSMS
ncbi:unnamed protein product [Schistosoma mattheei]|uniref:Uncharacterized protein n=1 Tax=Schistosoma mattheei TaxID=31246 RepID=A0A183NVF0_9TREM|nr:unnamed protein product [Schistosoma mattheei]